MNVTSGGVRFRAPSEVDFLALPGVAPAEAVPSDGYWRYVFEDDGVRLEISFHEHARSLQTVLWLNGIELVRVSHQNAIEPKIVSQSTKSS